MTVRRLTRQEARRIAVRAQLLDADRPARPADGGRPADLPAARPDGRGRAQRRPGRLVALGNAYDPAQLQQALEQDRTLFEHRGQDPETEPVLAMVRPMANLGLYLADMAAWPFGSTRLAEWMAPTRRSAGSVLDLLRSLGPAAVA